MENPFSRSEALMGAEAMARLRASRVAIVGIGGVGSWCAEALVRTGVGSVVLVDDDVVAISNLNRQGPATSRTLGRRKAEVMRERLLEISPTVEVTAVCERYEGGEPVWGGRRPDMVVDAIDSVDCKAELILATTAAGIPLVSSMGAALRMDPTMVVVRRFDKVEGDGLARALRQRFRRLERFPAAKFDCVCSLEPPVAAAERGSLMTVTAAFGMALASVVIRNFASAR